MRPPESFIEQPIRSLQTMLRVLAEDDPTLPIVIPDGIYSQNTMQAVTAFQYRNRLPVTGIVDQFTWERIVEDYEPARIRIGKAEPIEIVMDAGQVFRLGDESPYLYLLQGMLIQLSKDHESILPPQVTGVLDENTSISLRGFQQLSGLIQTGELDKITWKHLVRQFTLNAHHHTALHRLPGDPPSLLDPF